MPGDRDGPFKNLTPAVTRTLLDATRAGVPLKYAAEAAGVSERAALYWLSAGRRGTDKAAVRLVRELKKARAAGVAARLARITAAAEKNWQADAWVLERTHPRHFGAARYELAELRRQVKGLLDRLDITEASRGPVADGAAGGAAAGPAGGGPPAGG